MRHRPFTFTRPALLLVALLLVVTSTGCQTTVGNYFANRGRDLGECFLVQAGLAVGLGAEAKAAGLVHACQGLLCYFPEGSVGWVYGESRPAEVGASLYSANLAGEGSMGILNLHRSSRIYDGEASYHECYAFFPGVASWEDAYDEDHTWIWSDLPGETILKARIHVFDIEAGAVVGIVGARAGFSPGEFLDFLLGWVGIDIAGDDRELVREEEETTSLVPEPRQATEGERLK